MPQRVQRLVIWRQVFCSPCRHSRPSRVQPTELWNSGARRRFPSQWLLFMLAPTKSCWNAHQASFTFFFYGDLSHRIEVHQRITDIYDINKNQVIELLAKLQTYIAEIILNMHLHYARNIVTRLLPLSLTILISNIAMLSIIKQQMLFNRTYFWFKFVYLCIYYIW